jgi:hypothetical protein
MQRMNVNKHTNHPVNQENPEIREAKRGQNKE